MKILFKKKFLLIVSLPFNDLQLAKHAIKGGADAIKVHLNVEHKASNTAFGSFVKEKDKIEEILKLKVPVGLMPGTNKECASLEEINYLVSKGLSFIDIYESHTRTYILELRKVSKMIAISSNYEISRIKFWHKMGIDALEASIIEPNLYGNNLSFQDLSAYAEIISNTSLPVIIPTQKYIEPKEVKFLKDIGAKGIMIGAIVMGKSPLNIMEKTTEYRKIIDKLEKL